MSATLEGRTALVTGGSRGIGAAICARLAAEGAHVVGTATSESGAQAIGEALGSSGEGRVLDVRDSNAVRKLVGELSRVDILVNNAGITRDGLAMRMKDEDWDAVLATNLSAAFVCARTVLRGMMKAHFGRIISIGSVVGAAGNPGQANYCASKAGLVGMSKSLAREVGSRGITVNVVAPGFIETDMTQALEQSQRDALLEQIPSGRLGAVADIAGAVAFLAGPDAAYVNGETLHVNGGMHMA